MENGVVNIINNMDKSRFSNIICSLTTSDDYQYRISSDRRNIYNINKRDGNDITVPFKIASIIKKNQIDIVHARGWPTYLEGLLAAKLMCWRVKFIYSYHGRTIDDVQYIPKRRLKIQKYLSFFADCIMTLSNEMASEYASMIGINSENIKVIYNGVETDKFSGTNVELESLREELSIKKDDYVVGFVGRIDPVKDLQTLIDAIFIVKADINNIKLIIVGDGSEMAKLQNYLIGNGMMNNVIFTGQRDDIGSCLSIMNIYVQPSLYEGMSNTIVEAMAGEKTVLATNVGGTPELINHEVDGILFSPGKPEKLAQHILDLYQNPDKAHSLANKAYRKVIEKFSMFAMIENYEKLYTTLLT